MNLSSFGRAVHAVLPYVRHHGCKAPFNYCLPYIRSYLPRQTAWGTMPVPQRDRLVACWHYLWSEVIVPAEWVCLEPPSSAGYRPDMVLLKEDVIRVVEVKVGVSQRGLQKGRKQVKSLLKDLKPLCPPHRSMEGFCLTLTADPRLPFKPLWRPVVWEDA